MRRLVELSPPELFELIDLIISTKCINRIDRVWDSPSSRPAVTMLDASTMLDIVDQIKLFLFYSRRHRHTTVDATKIMIDTIPVSARLIQTLSALKKLYRFL